MALSHLLDTSVLTRLHRDEVVERLAPLLSGRHLSRAVMSDLETGFSARNGSEWDEVMARSSNMDRSYVLPRDYDAALAVQRALADLGQRGRKPPDLLIAAVAARRRLTVLHYDRDFELLAAVTGQSQEWVVPAGSVP